MDLGRGPDSALRGLKPESVPGKGEFYLKIQKVSLPDAEQQVLLRVCPEVTAVESPLPTSPLAQGTHGHSAAPSLAFRRLPPKASQSPSITSRPPAPALVPSPPHCGLQPDLRYLRGLSGSFHGLLGGGGLLAQVLCVLIVGIFIVIGLAFSFSLWVLKVIGAT